MILNMFKNGPPPEANSSLNEAPVLFYDFGARNPHYFLGYVEYSDHGITISSNNALFSYKSTQDIGWLKLDSPPIRHSRTARH